MSTLRERQTLAFYKHQLLKQKEMRKKEQAYIAELIQEKKWLLSEIIRIEEKNNNKKTKRIWHI